MTSLPTWAVYTLGFGSPLLTFIGVLIGQVIGRRGAYELEARSKREELMRMLRWASELAISDDEAHARLGVAELGALLGSSLLTVREGMFVRAALEASLRNPVERIEQLGANAQVTVMPGPDFPAGPDVRSKDETDPEDEN